MIFTKEEKNMINFYIIKSVIIIFKNKINKNCFGVIKKEKVI